MQYDEMLANLETFARQNFVPIVREKTIEKVCEILQNEDSHAVLEIGTAIGYSGIRMLHASSQIKLTTIEKNQERFLQAKENFKEFRCEERVVSINGDALEEIEKLQSEGKKFDFVFLDGPKGQYFKYLKILKNLLTVGGILFADNILLGGLVQDESRVCHKNRTMVRNMKSFIDKLEKDNDFETMVYDIDDGFSISKLKKSAE